MDITNTTSNSAANFLDPTLPTRTTGKQVLDVNDFLKLITVQLNNQDPLKPMENTDFIAQMASFTSLEQMQTLSKDFSSFTKNQKAASAQDYLGKTVSITTTAGPITGPVTGVSYESGVPLLAVNGGYFDPSSVTSISLSAASNSTVSNSTGPTVPSGL